MKSSCLKNKVIVVTGAAGLIGQTFVKAIIDNGGIAVVADINFTAAKKVAQDCSNNIDSTVAKELDITKKESITNMMKALLEQYGRIDAVINNAYPRSSNYGNKLEKVSYKDFCENINTHLGGYFLIAQQFCLVFKKQGYGNVVNMSSIYGSMTPRFEVYPDTSDMTMPVEYAAIKAAIEHLTRYFAQYYKRTGIRVNSLSPGGVLDGQLDEFISEYNKRCSSKGLLNPSDLIGALVFLLSDNSRYITGQNIIIDDGFSL